MATTVRKARMPLGGVRQSDLPLMQTRVGRMAGLRMQRLVAGVAKAPSSEVSRRRTGLMAATATWRPVQVEGRSLSHKPVDIRKPTRKGSSSPLACAEDGPRWNSENATASTAATG